MLPSLQLLTQGSKTSIDSGSDCTHGSPNDRGHFLKRQILLKAEHQHFAIDKVQSLHRLSKPLGILGARRKDERRRLTRYRRWRLAIVLRLQAHRSPSAHVIDGKITGDSKQPGLKPGVSVVGLASLQNPKPRFLHQVIDVVVPAQQVNEIADKTIQILLDQSLEERDIALAKATRNSLRIAAHSHRQGHIVIAHT